MVTTVTLCWTHDVTHFLPRTQRIVAHGIAERLRTASGSERHVVMSVALVEPRTLLVVLNCPIGFLLPRNTEVDLATLFLHRTHHTILLIEHIDVATGGDHVFVEFHTISMRIAPEHPSLSVVVNKHRWVDIIPVLLLPYEWLAEWVFERSVRRICYEHANTMSVQRCIEIELTVALHCLNSPSTVLTTAPFEVAERCHSTMFSPVHHIGS